MLAALVLATSASAAGNGLAAGSPGPLTATFTGGAYDEATANLVVKNPSASGGTLGVTWLSGGTTSVITANSSNPTEQAPVAIFLTTKTLTIKDHDAISIAVVFRRMKGAKAALKGDLAVRLDGASSVGPLVVPVTVSPSPTPNPTSSLKFEQEKSTIALVRLAGPLTGVLHRIGCDGECLLGESARVATTGQLAKGASATTLLPSDSGGVARVRLTSHSDPPSHFSITASNVRRPGPYDGTLALDPAAKKSASIKVTVHARDFILWPFLVALAGVFVAFVGVQRREARRNSSVAILQLKRSVQPYLDARAADKKLPEARQSPGRFILTLDPLLPPNSASPWVVVPKDGPPPASEVASLYDRASKIGGADDLTPLLPELTGVVAKFDRWSTLERERAALYGRTDTEMGPVIRRVAELTYKDPADDGEATKLVGLLRLASLVAALFEDAHARFEEHGEPDGLDPQTDLTILQNSFSRSTIEIETAQTDLATAQASLGRKLNILLQLPRTPPPQRHAFVIEELERSPVIHLEELRGRRAGTEVGRRVGASQSTPVIDTRTPETIFAQIRRVDWDLFWISAALAIGANLALKYNADYGSINDYLVAFTTAAVTPAVVDWAKLPFNRVYRLVAPAPASPAAS
jgi:hypothetical protein